MKKRANLRNWLVIIALLLAVQYSVGPPVWAGSVVGWGSMVVDSNDFAGRNFVAVAAGGSHSLALKADGSIAGWGYNYCEGKYWGQADPPEGNDFVAVAAGRWHSLALKADGSIVGWGRNWYGEAAPPSGNDFVDVSAGRDHSLAMKEVIRRPIEAEIKLAPDTLNLQSKGRWLTCRISLPEDYNVADIDPNSVLLEEEIAADRLVLEGEAAMAKFSRSALQQILADLETPAEVELLVTGELVDGTRFEGTDVVKVIDKRSGK